MNSFDLSFTIVVGLAIIGYAGFRIAETIASERVVVRPLSRKALKSLRADAWDEGAKWAAVELGGTDSVDNAWLAPGDNPYRVEPQTGGSENDR